MSLVIYSFIILHIVADTAPGLCDCNSAGNVCTDANQRKQSAYANYYRCLAGRQAMLWSDDLYTKLDATRDAVFDRLSGSPYSTASLTHFDRNQDDLVSENLFWGYNVNKDDVAKRMNMGYFEEYKNCNWDDGCKTNAQNIVSNGMVGHFTALMWDASVSMAAAAAIPDQSGVEVNGAGTYEIQDQSWSSCDTVNPNSNISGQNCYLTQIGDMQDKIPIFDAYLDPDNVVETNPTGEACLSALNVCLMDPIAEASSAEASSAEAPSSEAPITEVPSAEAPITEASSAEAPTEASSTEAPTEATDAEDTPVEDATTTTTTTTTTTASSRTRKQKRDLKKQKLIEPITEETISPIEVETQPVPTSPCDDSQKDGVNELII